LRAEIEVPEINAEEAASLKTSIASPEAFSAAGLEYNPAMAGLQATLQRRADGRAYIRLSSDRAINDPFVDMIVEASWSSGRILRDYTMLFDPPVLRRPAPTAPTLAQTSPAPIPSQSQSTITRVPTPVTAEPTRTTPAPRPAAVSPPAAAVKPTPSPANENAQRITVKAGDTASKIAAIVKPAGVSLDQMLVAMLRANPEAFVNNNINRIRAGAIVDVPSTQQAQALSAAEATQTVVAQSKDFNEFRRGLAANAPVASVAAASRKTSGAIDTKVDDKKASTVAPDKLTLSKGSVQAKADEARIAKERADKEAAARASEINKNISDLKKLGVVTAPPAAAPSPAPAPSQPTPAALPTPTVPIAAIAVAPVVTAPASTPVAPPAAVAVSAPVAPASSAVIPASAPAKPNPAAVPVPAAYEPPGLIDDLLSNPWLPYGVGLLLAGLGGFAFWRNRQRKKNQSHMDSSFLESRLQPDSFFGASGGQRVDTNSENSATGSSMVYSASQLDAADDVDPVAEADVYLAYGRDLQAEEILREAVRTNPGRLAIHTKLLEIFAKRRDARNFEASATQAYQLTGSNSPDWARICEMGLAFDPSNALYQPGGAPSGLATQPVATGTASSFNSTIAQMPSPALGESVSGVDLDLDLDFSLDEEGPVSGMGELTSAAVTPLKAEQTVKMDAPDLSAPLDMDFDLSELDPPAAPAPAPAYEPVPSLPDLPLQMDGLKLDDDDQHALPDFNLTTPAPAAFEPPPASAHDAGMLEFDLGSLSLDLDSPAETPTDAPDSISGGDPQETKLALAEEFVSIGDEDGARALIEEVVSEATGEMRAKAQRALANLS
jgi:pilus assembly protein FimV